MKQIIQTANAPKAIGTYSQATKSGTTVYLSGQIPLDPKTMQLVSDDFEQQTRQVFENLLAVIKAAGGTSNNVLRLTVYLTDLTQFPVLNQVMAHYFSEPYPARAVIGVAALPKGAQVEIDGIMVLSD